MKELKCKNCGAFLKYIDFGKYKCEYCGSVYETESQIYIREVHPGCAVVQAEAVMDEEFARRYPEYAAKEITNQLTQSLADGLKDFLTIEENIDWRYNKRYYRGKIRIVPTEYRY